MSSMHMKMLLRTEGSAGFQDSSLSEDWNACLWCWGYLTCTVCSVQWLRLVDFHFFQTLSGLQFPILFMPCLSLQQNIRWYGFSFLLCLGAEELNLNLNSCSGDFSRHPSIQQAPEKMWKPSSIIIKKQFHSRLYRKKQDRSCGALRNACLNSFKSLTSSALLFCFRFLPLFNLLCWNSSLPGFLWETGHGGWRVSSFSQHVAFSQRDVPLFQSSSKWSGSRLKCCSSFDFWSWGYW